MTNEEKINEIISTMKSEAADLGFCFDCAMESAVRFACGWMADYKDNEAKNCANCAHSYFLNERFVCDGYNCTIDILEEFKCFTPCDNWQMKGGTE